MIEIKVNQEAYSKQALLSTAHSFAGDFETSVDKIDGCWKIVLIPKKKGKESEEDVEQAFLSSLVDYQLRIDLEEHFRPIRELIVNKALTGKD